MLFSVNYKSKHKDQADEIKCSVNQLGLIYKYIQDHPDKRYNIKADNLDDKAIEQIDIVKSITQSYTVECTKIKDMRKARSLGLNTYIKYPVTDWETFDNLSKLGVSDIYIDGPLGFQFDKLTAASNRPLIRVSPTVSANAAINPGSNLDSFFIRPEDLMTTYKSAIDVVDFNVSEQDIEDMLFKIYKRGTFYTNLEDLVDYVHYPVANPMIPSNFAEHRYNCGQKCKVPGHACRLCYREIVLLQKAINYFKADN